MDATPSIPDFELIRRVGGGSYGDVWLGRSVTGIYRAIKIVDRSRFKDSRPFLREFDGIKRFQKAVGGQQQQLALLHVGCDEEAGILYYVMELADDVVTGTDIDPATYVPATLKAVIAQRAPLPTSECVSIGIYLGIALAGLHKAGLIHRDVKPSNIIFVGGIPKLADVGLVASSEQTMTSLGTPGYAPPEGGGSVSGDLYSLGKIMYELATQLGPDEYPRVPLSIMTPPLLELNEIILRACDPLPARRYPTAESMVEQLRLIQAGRSVRELNRYRRTFRFVVKLSLVGAIMCVAGLIFLSVQNYRMVAQNERAARYTADLYLASWGRSAGDFGASRLALKRQIPSTGASDLRGFEWFALWNETRGDSLKMGRRRDHAKVSALALSPDERLLIAQEGESPGRTVVWDIAGEKPTAVLTNTTGVGGFSSDGLNVTVEMEKHHVFAFNLQNNLRRPPEEVPGRVVSWLANPDSLLLTDLKGEQHQVMLWDVASRGITAEWKASPDLNKTNISAAAVSLDRGLLAVGLFGSNGVIRHRNLIVYDFNNQAERFRLTDVDRVWDLCFSPDGQNLAIAMANQPLRIVSTDNGGTVRILSEHRSPIRTAEFSPDGRKLATAGLDRSVHIWDAKSGKRIKRFRGHEAEIVSLIWFADSERLITGSRDGSWRLWSLSSQPEHRVFSQVWTDVLGDFIFAPDGRTLALSDKDGRVAILNSDTLERQETIAEAFHPLLYDDDGGTLLALSRERQLLRYRFSDQRTIPIDVDLKGSQSLVVVEASADRRRVAFGFDGGELEVLDATRDVLRRDEHFMNGQIGALAWAPDNQTLMGGGNNGPLVNMTPHSSSLLPKWAAQNSTVYSIAYSPVNDGLLAIGRADGQVALLDCIKRKVITVLTAHSGPVSALAFSPNGSRLLTAGHDGMIMFWSLPSLRQTAIWSWDDDLSSGARPRIARLKFDPAGSRLGAMTEEGAFRIWDGRSVK